MFVTVDTDEDDHRRVIEFLGLKGEPLPTMRIIQVSLGSNARVINLADDVTTGAKQFTY